MRRLQEIALVRFGKFYVEEALDHISGPPQIYSQWHCEAIPYRNSPLRQTRSGDARLREAHTAPLNEGWWL